ncbi:DNA-3-methyladenine glycosylase [bacterium]|nr:DNA-3-methyladenine glycosylase [bacterium]
MQKLDLSFYTRNDVVQVSKELLGKFLMTNFDGKITGGMIVETEAYAGITDKASHSYGNRRTKRTETMFCEGGTAYVYLCYGMYNLFNVVTNVAEIPQAVLIRAIEPTENIETMLQRRKMAKLQRNLTAGPGTLTLALGIRTDHTGTRLFGEKIWIEDRKINFSEAEILASERVGVAYAGEDAKRPWRFRVKNSLWTSLAK